MDWKLKRHFAQLDIFVQQLILGHETKSFCKLISSAKYFLSLRILQLIYKSQEDLGHSQRDVNRFLEAAHSSELLESAL